MTGKFVPLGLLYLHLFFHWMFTSGAFGWGRTSINTPILTVYSDAEATKSVLTWPIGTEL